MRHAFQTMFQVNLLQRYLTVVFELPVRSACLVARPRLVCADVAPTSPVQCPLLPSPLSICSFSKAAFPGNVNIALATKSFVGQGSLRAGDRPHLVRCAGFSFGASHRLAVVVLLGLAPNCFSPPASFPACFSFGRVSSSSSIAVPAHGSSSLSVSSCSSLHSFSRLGPVGFQFLRGLHSARAKQVSAPQRQLAVGGHHLCGSHTPAQQMTRTIIHIWCKEVSWPCA